MHQPLANKQLCLSLRFTHKSGDVLHPSTMRDNQSGTISWIVAKPGTGNNTKEHEIRVFDEATLIDYVVGKRYSVRCRSTNDSRTGLYSPDGHSVRFEYVVNDSISRPAPTEARRPAMGFRGWVLILTILGAIYLLAR